MSESTSAPSPGSGRTGAPERSTAGPSVPLGLAAFGVTTFMVGWVMSGRLPLPGLQAAALTPLILIMGAFILFIAGLWALRTGHALAGTFFCIFGGFYATMGAFEIGIGPFVRAAIQFGSLRPELQLFGVITGCFTFVALFIALASLSAGAAASGGISLADAGVGIVSLALAVSLFFITWSLFASGDQTLTQISGWASVIAGGLALVSAAAVTLAGGLSPELARGPLGALPGMRGGAQRPQRPHPV